MTFGPSAATLTLLEKLAVDNGFDRELPREGAWLAFASTQSPLRIWLSAPGEALFLAALSQSNVAVALDTGTTATSSLPSGAVAARAVTSLSALHRLVRRAFQLSKTLPHELLYTFEKQTATLPRSTEAERVVVQRVGQSIFRAGLLEYWEGRCAVTGLAVPGLLRASHIKPWADCASDAERLDVFNGLLLAPHLDAAFDCGFITVADDSTVVVSDRLGEAARHILGLANPQSVTALAPGHRAYLPWHRERVFRKNDSR
ncbi:MAG TPA: HNH endonuclease [Thermoanaerobaculia bacterium]|nr:HNH endonuclease [Thermoanaerobaculia bacterium]